MSYRSHSHSSQSSIESVTSAGRRRQAAAWDARRADNARARDADAREARLTEAERREWEAAALQAAVVQAERLTAAELAAEQAAVTAREAAAAAQAAAAAAAAQRAEAGADRLDYDDADRCGFDVRRRADHNFEPSRRMRTRTASTISQADAVLEADTVVMASDETSGFGPMRMT
ncbi:unnamed protein product [Miscanthus lutarioriparius]|uniref:Uncharacterized protein n=1 Tax=Miscanthus lutarioriparius TaxID=422564 RepID=A0A811MD17_9POAL|nr:unnamed protein product [Miscanthus lutarioriparius]